MLVLLAGLLEGPGKEGSHQQHEPKRAPACTGKLAREGKGRSALAVPQPEQPRCTQQTRLSASPGTLYQLKSLSPVLDEELTFGRPRNR